MEPNNVLSNVGNSPSRGTVDIGALQQQSQAQFGQLNDFMGQNGFIFNPTTGTFVQNPNFLNPLQMQQATGTSPAQPAQTAGNAAASAEGSASAALGLPLSNTQPGEVPNLVTPTGQKASGGATENDIANNKVVQLDASQRGDLTTLDNLQQFITQLGSASQAVNKVQKGTFTASSPEQEILGFFKNVSGDPNAKFLSGGASALSALVPASTTGSTRFNTGQIDALKGDLPSIGDTREQADAKLQRLQDYVNTNRKDILGTSPNAQIQDGTLTFKSADEAAAANLPVGTHIMIDGHAAHVE